MIAILLGGPASARSMKDFLAYPAARVDVPAARRVHPVPYLRMFIQVEMLRRMGFLGAARRIQRVWSGLYDGALRHGRVPARLIATARRIIPHVIDEVAFQPRRGLAQRALVDVVPFTAADERAIQHAAPVIARGELPADLPPRFAVSASRYALERRMAPPLVISRTVLMGLAQRGARTATDAPTAIGPVALRDRGRQRRGQHDRHLQHQHRGPAASLEVYRRLPARELRVGVPTVPASRHRAETAICHRRGAHRPRLPDCQIATIRCPERPRGARASRDAGIERTARAWDLEADLAARRVARQPRMGTGIPWLARRPAARVPEGTAAARSPPDRDARPRLPVGAQAQRVRASPAVGVLNLVLQEDFRRLATTLDDAANVIRSYG